MTRHDPWPEVTAEDPCPVCGHDSWCLLASDGGAAWCGRETTPPTGWRAGPPSREGTNFVREGERRQEGPRRQRPSPPRPDPPREPGLDWAADAERFAAALSEERLLRLADELRVDPEALRAIGTGWAGPDDLRRLRAGGAGWQDDYPAGAYVFPERDGCGRVVGLSLRAPDGRKGAPSGSGRGLVVPAGLENLAGPVVVVEGGSDVAAALTLGLAAVGRPSNRGGAAELGELLRGREVLVIGERDKKPDGRWPGREGAVRVATALARAWRLPVRWTLPPEGAKDVRAWLGMGISEGLDLGDVDARRAAGAELLTALHETAQEERPPLCVHLQPDTYGRHRAALVIGEPGEDVETDDVLHTARLRIAEEADRATWAQTAGAAAAERAPWIGNETAARERISGLLDRAVRETVAAGLGGESDDDDGGLTVAESIVRLALKRYRLGVSTDGEPFAVAHGGPNVATSLRGSARSLRALLAREYRRETGATPSGSALADALTVLAGEAQERDPEPVHLRIAREGERVIVDLGDTSGRAITVDASGWRVVDHSPVLYRRTALTAPMPMPEGGGELAELWELVPVAESDRDLVLGWLVHALIPDEPHAILLLGGPAGAGKSTAAEYVVGLVDPSGAPTRAEPRDPRQWAITAAGSWVIALDNISSIPPWLSDALCRAATGDGWVDRALYTDSELAVLRYLRVVLLTSIDAGALRGDLGERILLADLERIPASRRQSKRALDERYEAARPRLLGALLDLLASALARLPGISPNELPRMADYARVLAALDEIRGTDSLARYEAQAPRIAEDVVEGDLVATAVLALARDVGAWTGTAADLLARITPEPVPRGWPRTPTVLSGRLRRVVQPLRELGVIVSPPAGTDRPRRWTVRLAPPPGDSGPGVQEPDSSVGCVGASKIPPPGPEKADSSPTLGGPERRGERRASVGSSDGPTLATHERRARSGPGAPGKADPDAPDAPDARTRALDAGSKNSSGRAGPEAPAGPASRPTPPGSLEPPYPGAVYIGNGRWTQPVEGDEGLDDAAPGGAAC